MKNLNLIERLLSYSHEKQKPQRFGRYAVMLLLLLTCVTHAWATTYYAIGELTAWAHTESEKMTRVGSSNTYYMVVSNKSARTYRFRVDEGNWEKTHGWSEVVTGSSDFTLTDAEDGDNSINIELTATSTLTIWFNPENSENSEGNKIWVTSGGYATQTIYVIGSNSWTDSNVKAHVWDSDAPHFAWDDDEPMTKVSTISRANNTYKVYSYTVPKIYKRAIFRYGDGQTGTLTWDASTPYYSTELSAWFASTADALAKYLVGTNWTDASWDYNAAANKMTDNGDGSYSKDIAIPDASKTIKLKVSKKGTWGYAYGGEAAGTGHNLSTGFGTDDSGNLTFKVAHAGTTKITLTSTTGKIDVDAPYQVSYAEGTGASGTVSASSVTTYGSTCSLSSSTFTKTYYTQDGWATSDGGDKAYNLGGTYTGGYVDVTLYPHWTKTTYSITLDDDGDYGGNGSATVQYGDKALTVSSDASRAGWNLVGYFAGGTGEQVTDASGNLLPSKRFQSGGNYYDITNSSSEWIYDGNLTLYAHWTKTTYSITLNDDGDYDGDGSATVQYGDAALTVSSHASRAGWNLVGYFAGGTGDQVTDASGNLLPSKRFQSGGNYHDITNSSSEWIYDGNLTLYAHWTANNYTVTLSAEDEDGYGDAGENESVSATYDATMPAMGYAPTPLPGWKFMGYFTDHNGAGTKYYNADGSSATNWNIASATTLYAHFQKTVISSLEHPAAVATGETVYVDVNPVLNQEGAQPNMKICWSLLYDNDNPVESGVAVAANPVDGKPNQVRFTLTDLSSGYYKIQAVLYANSSVMATCDDGTELSTIKSDLRIAGNSKVTIQYEDASGNTIAAATSVEVARGDSIGVKAPSIIGYAFDKWVLGDVISNSCKDDATCDLDEDSINIKATYDGYLTAKYEKKQMIYFNNTLGWDTVYVYFYNNSNYWADQGTGSKTGEYDGAYTGKCGGMTKIAGTNVYYYDLAAHSVSTSLTNVAFTKDLEENELYFRNTNVIGRGDYSGTLSMYVPLTGVDPVEKNTGDGGIYTAYYYEKGYWMNYPESTGYTLKIYDNTTDGALKKELKFTFPADKKMPMSITTDLEGGKTYGFKIYRKDDNEYGNNGTMTNGHSGDGVQDVWEFKTEKNRAGLTTTSAGDYTFTLSYGVDLESNYNYLVGVHYPEAVGDYRILYTDGATWTTGKAHVAETWKQVSRVIAAKANATDTVSFFISKGSSPEYKIEKVTEISGAGVPTWAEVLAWTSCNDVAEAGVYNFIFTQDENKDISLSKKETYTGNFYIRVDGAGSSNWDNFRAADHLMPYSDYSFKQTENPYSHYFMEWREAKDLAHLPNIKFVVANDYSVNVSDTIVKDGVADAYVDDNGYISRRANIRFMYNYKTNEATRRYVDGARESGSEFLMIIPGNSKIYAAAEGGDPLTQLTFSDKGNWVYEAEVYALPTATYKLRSKFGENPKSDDGDWGRKGEITQYFKGGESTTETLIGGDPESTTRVKIRLLYDFKTNRVVAAYQPSGNINEDLEIHADIMFMREHQEDIEQITFAEGKSISAIENIYCCLKFNKYTLNNLSKEEPHGLLPSLLSRYERDIFYVSFPYDVRLSDVIGFGTYGQHWIVEYYDGAARAKNGFWIDSESYWKFVTPAMKDTFTLKAGTGYIVALDLDEMWYINDTYHADIWNNTTEVEILFPGDISTISNRTVTYNMPSHACTINRGTTAGNRTKKDSHWNVLGVPTFKNITGAASADGGGSGEIRFANVALLDTLVNEMKFIYDGNLADNSLTPKAVKDFEFKAMHAYVVQYCGDVTFNTSATPVPASVAARTYAEEPIDVDFRLELNKDGVLEDQTFVSLSNDENASADFRFGEDLSKEFNNNRANIYTFIGTEWVAGNTLPMTNQTTIVPVGVKIAADGEYTFSIPEGTYGVGITLIDNEAGARVNLGLMDYTVTLAAGQIDDRFVLEISPIHQSPTGVELLNGENGENGVRKVLIDNILYIVKDGVVYDAQGNRVK